ncbi:MAG: trimethylamine methyltransferase family protein [Haloarculaceae archaeon]
MNDRSVLDADHLSETDRREIHDASLRILSDTGVEVGLADARELLADHGADVDGDVVRVPPALVEDALDSAPESFTWHARNPDNDVAVGGSDGETVFAPAYGASNVLTVDGTRRSSTRSDYERLLKLVQQADAVTSTGYTVCEVGDCSAEAKPYEMTSRSLLYSDKPVMGDTFGRERAEVSLDLTGIAVEDRDLSKPYVAGQITPVSPRRLSGHMAGGLLAYAERGQPLVFASVVMAGATGPATLAGAFALANAEVLFAITLAQLAHEGVPVVYGAPATTFDMHATTMASGSPEGALATAFTGQMADFYGLPARAGGCLTDAKTVDDQAGSESMQHLLTTLAADVDVVVHAAGMLEAYATVSPVKFVLDCERIATARRLQDGYEVSEKTLALDLVTGIEPGGDFLSERHTVTNVREEHFMPDLADRSSHDDWERDGSPTAADRGRERVEAWLEEYERPPIPDDVEAAIEEYVDEGP